MKPERSSSLAKGRAIDAFPLTPAAFIQHIKKSCIPSWSQLMIAFPVLPLLNTWGWCRNVGEGWEVYWTALPEVSQVCRELICWECKKGCRGRCKC